MKTVLIVEDEKMIRQGIKTMVQRSGVPVDVIMECNNGDTAFEILQSQEIDVMFTDIRMPKMNGIELVQKMQGLAHKPLTVAISGYDDFSYAVELMRQGVREYILKPVERQKITEILKKLNQEIEEGRRSNQTNRQLGYQHLKYLVLNKQVTESEMHTLIQQYENTFLEGSYHLCCRKKGEPEHGRDRYIFLDSIGDNDVFIVKEDNLELLLKNELAQEYTGVSKKHQGISEIRTAYMEAVSARHVAFCQGRLTVYASEEKKHIPDQILEEAGKLIQAEAHLQRIQLIGTEKTEEMKKVWDIFFSAVKAGRIDENDFNREMNLFFKEMEKTYRNVIGDDTEPLRELSEIWNYDCLEQYQELFFDWLMGIHNQIGEQYDNSQNKQKIQLAVKYIKENFSKDLNMAVVSNHISMNYSLFSYSFKQCTGSNFVNYLKNIRMEEAKKLLAETDLKIIEISQKVGYDNEKHFMKIFKLSCGVSPSEFRKNTRLQ